MSKITNFKDVKEEKKEKEIDIEKTKKQEEAFEAMKPSPKHIVLELGINGDKTPMSIKEVDGKNITLDDVMYINAALDVNNFAHLINRAIISNSTPSDVLGVYMTLEENRLNMVNASIYNMLKTQSTLNPHPIYQELLNLIEQQAKEAQEMMEEMKDKHDKETNNSGIIIPR